jgi:ParB family chromosome partitioning protein
VINGQISMGHARVLAGLKTRQEQTALRDMILNKDLSVRQTEAIARKGKRFVRSNKKRAELDYYMQSLSDNLKRSLGTKVDIKKRGRQGRIVIYFYSDDELDRLLELLA